MKKAEEYIELKTRHNSNLPEYGYSIDKVDALEIIKQVQIDAIKETVKECVKNAKIEFSNFKGTWESNDVSVDEFTDASVSKNSILLVADKLIKKLGYE
jgi:formylmethanofuran dehydrogenase subunit A